MSTEFRAKKIIIIHDSCTAHVSLVYGLFMYTVKCKCQTWCMGRLCTVHLRPDVCTVYVLYNVHVRPGVRTVYVL